MKHALAFIVGVAGLATMGCGRDEVVLGLDYTYAQILARSSGFEIVREFPFKWRFDEATTHLDVGGGTLFTIESARGHGFVNHPNPSQIKLEVADWMGAHIVDATLFVHDLVSLESARLPEKTLALMAALSAAGWKPRRPLPSVAEIKATLAVPPHHGEWVFDGEPPRYVSVTMWWQPEDEGRRPIERRGVHMSIMLSTNEILNAPLKGNIMFTGDHIMVTE